MLILLFKGLIIGFAIAAPVGPIGVLCIQRSLNKGFKIGMVTGLGAAVADGTYGLIAGFSLTALFNLLIAYQFWIRILGGVFLLYLGINLFFTPLNNSVSQDSENSVIHAFASTYLLTLVNPTTLVSFIAIFAGLGIVQTSANYTNAILLVLGITVGSAMWWLLLSGSITFILHHRLKPAIVQSINRLSGIIIFFFGLIALSLK